MVFWAGRDRKVLKEGLAFAALNHRRNENGKEPDRRRTLASSLHKNTQKPFTVAVGAERERGGVHTLVAQPPVCAHTHTHTPTVTHTVTHTVRHTLVA